MIQEQYFNGYIFVLSLSCFRESAFCSSRTHFYFFLFLDATRHGHALLLLNEWTAIHFYSCDKWSLTGTSHHCAQSLIWTVFSGKRNWKCNTIQTTHHISSNILGVKLWLHTCNFHRLHFKTCLIFVPVFIFYSMLQLIMQKIWQ